MLAGFQKITRNLRVSISAVLVKIEMGSFLIQASIARGRF
jgi:hypothetical protein